MEEKRSKVVVFLIGIIILLIGAILFVVINNKDKENNLVKENNEELENINYNNYQDKEIDFSWSFIEEKKYETIRFYIENNALKATANKEQLAITGLNGNIKSFTYNELCGMVIILVINENNEVFYVIIDENVNNDKIVFSKLSTSEKIVDITTHVNTVYSEGCSPSNIAVVLENGEIRAVEIDENNKVTIGNEDYSIYLTLFNNFIILKNQTLREIHTNETILYNNQEFQVDKLYFASYETDVDKIYYYALSNDKLYKITLYYGDNVNYDVTLVSDKKVIKTTTNNIGLTEVTDGDSIKEIITFEDNTTKTIETDSIYIIK